MLTIWIKFFFCFFFPLIVVVEEYIYIYIWYFWFHTMHFDSSAYCWIGNCLLWLQERGWTYCTDYKRHRGLHIWRICLSALGKTQWFLWWHEVFSLPVISTGSCFPPDRSKQQFAMGNSQTKVFFISSLPFSLVSLRDFHIKWTYQNNMIISDSDMNACNFANASCLSGLFKSLPSSYNLLHYEFGNKPTSHPCI